VRSVSAPIVSEPFSECLIASSPRMCRVPSEFSSRPCAAALGLSRDICRYFLAGF